MFKDNSEDLEQPRKHSKERVPQGLFDKLAEDVVLACRDADAGAIDRIGELLGGRISVESIRNRVWLRLNTEPHREFDYRTISAEDGRLFVARLYGFAGWKELEASFSGSSAGKAPFYKIHGKDRSIEPQPPLTDQAWGEMFDLMRQQGITSLRTGHMTDAALEQLSRLDLVTSLHLEGSRRVTDAGLAHLGRMDRLERLNLTGCSMTDDGLRVLGQLPELREFYLYHHAKVSDLGLAHLGSCQKLERVDLLGSNSGDGAIRALTGKSKLRHFKSGNKVTDAGLPFLHQFPVFKTWQGGEPEFSLMTYQPEPNLLLLRGDITDEGMSNFRGLNGLFGLNLDDSDCSVSSIGVKHLATLPHLEWLAFDATDESMAAIAAIPHLRNLMCQDTTATDVGFQALSQSRTLEYIWGRRCYKLTGVGFRALSTMPSLRGLSVSCKNVDDDALATLPDFPALTEFMPMDVPDEGFRHVGKCAQLEKITCMYCQDTGDIATEHLTGLRALKSYYAGQTRITDRSLEILSRMESLEILSFEACAGVTGEGIRLLARLPKLKELSVALMPGVTQESLQSFPLHVQVSYES